MASVDMLLPKKNHGWFVFQQSLTPNHIFLSDLTLITNYIIFAAEEAKWNHLYFASSQWIISDFLIYIHFPSFFISRPTDCIITLSTREELNCHSAPSTKQASYNVCCNQSLGPNTSDFKQEITLSFPFHTTKNQCFWDRRNFSRSKILWICTYLLLQQINYNWWIKVPCRSRQSACPCSLTMGKVEQPDHVYISMSDHMRERRSSATASFLSWYALLLVTHLFCVAQAHEGTKLYWTAFTELRLFPIITVDIWLSIGSFQRLLLRLCIMN